MTCAQGLIAGWRTVVVGAESASGVRGELEHSEEVAGDEPRHGMLGCRAAVRSDHDVEISGGTIGVEARQNIVMVTDVAIQRIGHEIGRRRSRPPRVDGRRIAERHQLLGVRHRQRAQEQRVDEREDGRVRADAERQREHHR